MSMCKPVCAIWAINRANGMPDTERCCPATVWPEIEIPHYPILFAINATGIFQDSVIHSGKYR